MARSASSTAARIAWFDSGAGRIPSVRANWTPAANVALARQTIDLLGVLQEKTKGNLDGDEERLLDQVLYDLRLRFVELSKAAAEKKG